MRFGSQEDGKATSRMKFIDVTHVFSPTSLPPRSASQVRSRSSSPLCSRLCVGLALCLSTIALSACSEIAPVHEVDLCKQTPPDANCQQCRTTPRDPSCPQCIGKKPAAGCANTDGGTGVSGLAGESGTGGMSGGAGKSGDGSGG